MSAHVLHDGKQVGGLVDLALCLMAQNWFALDAPDDVRARWDFRGAMLDARPTAGRWALDLRGPATVVIIDAPPSNRGQA